MSSRRPPIPVLSDGEPPEILVFDEEEACPYLTGERARMPLRLPTRTLMGTELDARLASGDRRTGPFLYRPTCASCSACRAIRLDVHKLRLRARHRRVLARGDRAFALEIGPVLVDEERVALYNAHLRARALDRTSPPLDLDAYRRFLGTSCCWSFEIRYRLEGRLAAVAIADRGGDALSAVYCYYDPAVSRLSPGTYSILKEVELCRHWGLRYLYLGLYVAGCRAMAYKATFLPHEQLVDGAWREFV
jgi:arginine-tRNA-protein transferase